MRAIMVAAGPVKFAVTRKKHKISGNFFYFSLALANSLLYHANYRPVVDITIAGPVLLGCKNHQRGWSKEVWIEEAMG